MRNIGGMDQLFKNHICKAGRKLENRLFFQIKHPSPAISEQLLINDDYLYSIKYSIYGGLLKTVMKQLEFEVSQVLPDTSETENPWLHDDIPVGTTFDAYIDMEYEGMSPWIYFNMGEFVVYSVEKNEERNTYFITCYDKMLYAMKDYEQMNITYPITIRNYIIAICNHLGLEFKNAEDTFPNYDKEIPNELYLSNTGQSLGYTFRDVLDDIAEATGSTITYDWNNGHGYSYKNYLQLKYIKEPEPYELPINEDFMEPTNVKFSEKYGPVNSIVLSRSGESDNVYLRDEESVEENGLCEIKIIDNQIMNDNNRSDYLTGILNSLNGLEYYINDVSTKGILIYEVLDKFNAKVGDTIYPCLLLNDEIDLTNGLQEHIYTELSDKSETDYKNASNDDRKINQVYIIAKKNEGEIESLVSSVSTLDQTENNNYQQIIEKFNDYAPVSDIVTIENLVRETITDTYTKTEIETKLIDGSVEKVVTETGTFDQNGLLIQKTDAPTENLLNEKGLSILDATGASNEELLFAGYDENLNETIVRTKNINVSKYLTIGTHSRIEDYEGGTGIFFLN